jgi:hypothetical protein
MAETLKKRPRDPIAPAKLIGDIAMGRVEDREQDNRNPPLSRSVNWAVRKGALHGPQKLSKRRKSEIAKNAAAVRWRKTRASE